MLSVTRLLDTLGLRVRDANLPGAIGCSAKASRIDWLYRREAIGVSALSLLRQSSPTVRHGLIAEVFEKHATRAERELFDVVGLNIEGGRDCAGGNVNRVINLLTVFGDGRQVTKRSTRVGTRDVAHID